MPKKNREYYLKRFTAQEKIVHNMSLDNEKVLKKIYEEARDELEKNLAFFIERYSKENNFSSSDLERMLNTKEKAKFRYSIEGYVKEIEKLGDTKEARALKKELDIMAGRTRVSRKQELISTINFELGKAGIKVKNTIGKHLENVAEFVIKDTNKIITGNTLTKLDTKMVERIVNQKWDDKNYSARVWSNRKNLAQKVMKNISIGFIQGYEFKKMSDRLAKDMNVGFYEARRLIETETTGALENAKTETFKELGVEKYQFVATIDDRTSEICLSLDGKIFDMKDRQMGVNCPFIHPFCRSVTVPVIDDKSVQKKEGKNKDEALKNNKKNDKIEAELNLIPLSSEELKYLDPYQTILNEDTYKIWIDSLTSVEKRGIELYTGSCYELYNGFMRGELTGKDIDEGIKKEIFDIIKSLSRYKTERTMTVYRGTYARHGIEKYAVGDNFILDKGFTSTSFSQAVAEDFTGGNGSVLYRIRIPKGKNIGGYVDELSSCKGEEEFLILPETKFKILRIGTKDMKDGILHVYDLEVL